jgi:hypothetical protein
MGDTFRLELAEGVVTGNVKVMLYGKSGAGKTFAASTCLPVDGEDFAVALVTEPNGVLSVTHGSVKTRVLIASWEETAPQVRDGKVIYYDGEPVMAPVIDPKTGKAKRRQHATNIKEVLEVMAALRAGTIFSPKSGRRPVALLVDSLTDIFRMFKDKIKVDKIKDDDGQSRAAVQFTQQDWGTLERLFTAFMIDVRDLPLSVVATALAQETPVKDSEGVLLHKAYRPGFEGSTGLKIMQFFNAVGFVSRSTKLKPSGGFQEVRQILWTGPERIECKGAAKLSGATNMLASRMSDVLAALCSPAAPPIHGVLAEEIDDSDPAEAEPQQPVIVPEPQPAESTPTPTPTPATSEPSESTHAPAEPVSVPPVSPIPDPKQSEAKPASVVNPNPPPANNRRRTPTS